jgi:hypothetical protein
MNKAPMPKQIIAWRMHPSKVNEELHGGWADAKDKREVSYTRTDVAQAQVAAAYDWAAEYMYQEWDDDDAQEHREAIRSLADDFQAALDRIVAEAVKEALTVKPLVWEYPTEYGVLMRSRTSVGTYSIHDDEDSAFGRLLCYLHLTDDGDSTRYAIDLGGEGYVEPEEMADRCARDYEARILSALKGGEA